MELKVYPFDTKYLTKDISTIETEMKKKAEEEKLDFSKLLKRYEKDLRNIRQGERQVRNIESRKDTKVGTVKWLSVKYLDSDMFGWIRPEWIEKEIKDKEEQ